LGKVSIYSKYMKFHGNSRQITVFLLVLGILFLVTVLVLIFTTFYYSRNSESLNPTGPVATTTNYLKQEEAVLVRVPTTAPLIGTTTEMLRVKNVLFEYVEVIDSCGPHFTGECLNARTGPGRDFPVQRQLRNGVVLKIGGSVERDGELWYQVIFDEFIRYPERLKGDWYVHSNYVRVLYDQGEKTVWENVSPTTTDKKIVVDFSSQLLRAYEGDTLYLETPISTGLELTPTPKGTFTIFKKTPSRYMQGPLPNLSDRQIYDLPGVPWNLYFTQGGAVIHGAYWHDSFGSVYSHGCVNLPVSVAQVLYIWADLGTKVIVED